MNQFLLRDYHTPVVALPYCTKVYGLDVYSFFFTFKFFMVFNYITITIFLFWTLRTVIDIRRTKALRLLCLCFFLLENIFERRKKRPDVITSINLRLCFKYYYLYNTLNSCINLSQKYTLNHYDYDCNKSTSFYLTGFE